MKHTRVLYALFRCGPIIEYYRIPKNSYHIFINMFRICFIGTEAIVLLLTFDNRPVRDMYLQMISQVHSNHLMLSHLYKTTNRCPLTSIGHPIMEIRRSCDSLISTMEFPILVRRRLYIESGPWFLLTYCPVGDALVIFISAISEHMLGIKFMTWWRHEMETFSALLTICAGNALLTICAGNSPVPGEFPTQRPVTRSFDVFFDLRLNKRLSIQSWGWWFKTPSRPLWRHCNDIVVELLSGKCFRTPLNIGSSNGLVP